MAIVVDLKKYQYTGPLDLLLDLVHAAKIDIKDIFISEITGQYLESMSQIDELDMDSASEFLQMAALLMEILSFFRLLLNEILELFQCLLRCRHGESEPCHVRKDELLALDIDVIDVIAVDDEPPAYADKQVALGAQLFTDHTLDLPQLESEQA